MIANRIAAQQAEPLGFNRCGGLWAETGYPIWTREGPNLPETVGAFNPVPRSEIRFQRKSCGPPSFST